MQGEGMVLPAPQPQDASSRCLLADRRHAMRGRLYYTAKAKKSGKVMIKTHPCSRLCFCKCWTCFKEVPSPGNQGTRQRRGWGTGPPAPSRPLYPRAPFRSALGCGSWLLLPFHQALPPRGEYRGAEAFLGSPSGVIHGGLLLPISGLGWEDQREHDRLLSAAMPRAFKGLGQEHWKAPGSILSPNCYG